jgi:hypothetical protein
MYESYRDLLSKKLTRSHRSCIDAFMRWSTHNPITSERFYQLSTPLHWGLRCKMSFGRDKLHPNTGKGEEQSDFIKSDTRKLKVIDHLFFFLLYIY